MPTAKQQPTTAQHTNSIQEQRFTLDEAIPQLFARSTFALRPYRTDRGRRLLLVAHVLQIITEHCCERWCTSRITLRELIAWLDETAALDDDNARRKHIYALLQAGNPTSSLLLTADQPTYKLPLACNGGCSTTVCRTAFCRARGVSHTVASEELQRLKQGNLPPVQRAPTMTQNGSRREQRARFVDSVIRAVVGRFAERSPMRAPDDAGNEQLSLYPPFTIVRVCELIADEAKREADRLRISVGGQRWTADGLDLVYRPLERTQLTAHIRRLFPRLRFLERPEVGECMECVTIDEAWSRCLADEATRLLLDATSKYHVGRVSRNRDADVQACAIANATPDLQFVVFGDQCAAAAIPNFAHAPKGSERWQKLLVEVLGFHVASSAVSNPAWAQMKRSPNVVYLYTSDSATQWKKAAATKHFTADAGRPTAVDVNKVDIILTGLVDVIVAYARTLPAAERKKRLRILIRYDATNSELYNKFGVMLESLLVSLGVCAGTASVMLS